MRYFNFMCLNLLEEKKQKGAKLLYPFNLIESKL